MIMMMLRNPKEELSAKKNQKAQSLFVCVCRPKWNHPFIHSFILVVLLKWILNPNFFSSKFFFFFFLLEVFISLFFLTKLMIDVIGRHWIENCLQDPYEYNRVHEWMKCSHHSRYTHTHTNTIPRSKHNCMYCWPWVFFWLVFVSRLYMVHPIIIMIIKW